MNAASHQPQASMSTADVPGGTGASPQHRAAQHSIDATDIQRMWELSEDLLCVANLQGRLVRFNAAWERALEIPAAQLVSRPLLELVHPPDRWRTLRAMASLARGRSEVRLALRVERGDRTLVRVSWSGCADPDRGLIYAIGRLDRSSDGWELTALGTLEAIRHAQRLAAADCEPAPVFEFLLDQILRASGSGLGAIGEIIEEDGRRILRPQALALGTLPGGEGICDSPLPRPGPGLDDFAPLLGEVLDAGKPVIANSLSAKAQPRGASRAGPPLESFLGLPLQDQEGALGVVGLANRTGRYDLELVRRIEPLISTTTRLLRSYRSRRDRKQKSDELRRSEERWSRSIELAAYPVILWNAQRMITYANKAALDLLQWRRHELVGRSLDDLLGDGDLDHRQALARMRQDGWSHRITNLRGAGGQEVPVELKAVDLGDGTFQAMLFDMREWVAIEKRLKSSSQRDNLTGLLNRRAIEEHADVEIHRARRRASSVSLLLIDIDRFKAINDRHGHLIGDAALQRVAELISSSVRITDWVGRWGGEEILVVLGETGEEEALRIGERIRAAIAGSPLETASHGQIALAVSVGVASGSIGYVPSLQQFFERVDRALYLAKQQGRNRVVCYQDTTVFRRFPALDADRRS